MPVFVRPLGLTSVSYFSGNMIHVQRGLCKAQSPKKGENGVNKGPKGLGGEMALVGCFCCQFGKNRGIT